MSTLLENAQHGTCDVGHALPSVMGSSLPLVVNYKYFNYFLVLKR